MSTYSSSPSSNEPVIPGEAAASALPTDTTVTATGTHRPDAARSRTPVAHHPERADGPEPSYDPVATVDLVDPLAPPGPADPPDALDPPDTLDPPGRTAAAARERPSGPARPAADAAGTPYRDPVSDLVHAAVADRPLEEVVDLITALERSPEHTRAVVDALRAAGIDRPVEDVTRLVALLTRPPRDADSADETIRAAAAHRSVEDVTRLVALLHSEPLAPHCRDEALRAAATGRSVDELVELIDRLAAHRPPEPAARTAAAPSRRDDRSHQDGAGGAGGGKPAAARRPGRLRIAARADGRRRTRRPRQDVPAGRETGRFRRGGTAARDRSPGSVARPVIWTSRLTAVALAVCAVAHFPLQRDGVSLGLHAFTVGLSVLCTVLALILVVRPGAVVLVAAVVVPSVLAAAHAYGGSFPSAALTRVVDLALAPPWLAGPAAVMAALLALAALVVRVASALPAGRSTPWPAAEAHRAAD
ncbi:hypothetical protein RKD24_000259 [Streptomyces calvus]